MGGKSGLSPLPVRLLAYAVMVLIAVAAIWLIDRRAMIREAPQPPAADVTP